MIANAHAPFAVWGHAWKGMTVRCLCDNAAIIRSGSAKDSTTMHLMHCLFFFTAAHQLQLAPMHLPGRENAAADHLSRTALQYFLQLFRAPSRLPPFYQTHLCRLWCTTDQTGHLKPGGTCFVLFFQWACQFHSENLQVRGKPLPKVLQFSWVNSPTFVTVSVVQLCVSFSGPVMAVPHY